MGEGETLASQTAWEPSLQTRPRCRHAAACKRKSRSREGSDTGSLAQCGNYRKNCTDGHREAGETAEDKQIAQGLTLHGSSILIKSS